MRTGIDPFSFLVNCIAGWMNQHQHQVIEYLIEENRILREQMGNRRMRFTDNQRRVETALDLCRADSAGISIFEPGDMAGGFAVQLPFPAAEGEKDVANPVRDPYSQKSRALAWNSQTSSARFSGALLIKRVDNL